MEKHWSGALNAPENRPDEGIERFSHDLIEWEMPPIYDGSIVSFRGALIAGGELSRSRLHRAREGGYPNFTLSLTSKHDYLGSILPGYVSDLWPAGHDLSKSDVGAFSKLARGWLAYADRPEAMNLPIHRLAGSFSRPSGRFGQEDLILDVAIALEVLYGGTTGHKLAQRAAALLGATAEEQIRAYNQAKGFYDARSRIVHWKKAPPSRDVLDEELEAGRYLACCLTLGSLLNRQEPLRWADVMRNLLPETQAYIEMLRRQQGKSRGV